MGVDSPDTAKHYVIRGAFWEDSLACPVSSFKSVTYHPRKIFLNQNLNQNMRQVIRGSSRLAALLFQAAGVCRRCPVPERNSLDRGCESIYSVINSRLFECDRLPVRCGCKRLDETFTIWVSIRRVRVIQGSLETRPGSFNFLEGK